MDIPIAVNKPYARLALANRYLASLESISMNHLDMKLSFQKIAKEQFHYWQNISITSWLLFQIHLSFIFQ